MKKILTLLGATTIALTANAAIVSIFEDTGDLSNFRDIQTVAASATEGGAFFEEVDGSATIGTGTALRVADLSTTTKPTAYFDFATQTTGFRLDLDYYNQSTISSDGEIRLVLGNALTSPDSDSASATKLGFDDVTDGKMKAGYNNGTKLTTTTTITGLYTAYSVSLMVNASATDSLEYTFLGETRTLAANTYDVYDGTSLLKSDLLMNETVGTYVPDYDPASGIGVLGLFGGGNSKAGADILFDNISLYTGADSGFVSAVPEPSTYAALAGLLALGFAASRRRRA